ncbi:tetratricopeptide repeat protein [Ancylomarina sp.]|uniref:tetratricopeptide repeat protein n=1 Tax=Ancylomarina sp. TaxID=1970196 RepID=UPI0035694787
MKKCLLTLLLCFISIGLSSQEKLVLDSLLIKLKYAEGDSQRVDVLCRLSDYYLNQDLLKSLEYSHKAIVLAGKNEEPSQMALVQFKRGQLFLLSGDYDMALTQLFLSLTIYEDVNDFLSLYKVYNCIGGIYDRIQDYDKALEFYFKALDSFHKQTASKKPQSENIHGIYNNIGNIYNYKNEKDTALEYYQKALKLAKSLDSYKIMGAIYNNLGRLYADIGDYDKALPSLERSLEYRKKVNDKEGLAISYSVLGKYYMMVEEEDKALQSLQKSLELGKEIGSLYTQNYVYNYMSIIFEQKGDKGKALQMHKLFKQTTDSLINQKTIQEITKVRMQFDFAKKEKLKEVEEQKAHFKFWLIILILTLSVLVIGLLYVLLKVNSKRMKLKQEHILMQKKNLEQDLEVKNKELVTSVMYLLKKNELMNDVSTRLIDLKSKLRKENLAPVQSILLDLQLAGEQDIWKEFELRFQQVHNEFYHNLQARFPDLTPGQVKICAFLRLNISSKEISSITHQSVNTIEVLRSRIRKKLDLTNTNVNLVTFLSEF